MGRLLGIGLATACIAISALLCPAAFAATLKPDTLADSNNPDVCSLRSALMAANTDAAVAGCESGDGDDRIELGAGTYRIGSATEDDNAARGDLDILDSVRIEGAPHGSTAIDGAGRDRVLDLLGGGTEVIVNRIVLDRGSPQGGLGDGGNIRVGSGASLLLVDSAVRRGEGADGGGIALEPGASATVVRSEIGGNDAASEGGGISVDGGDLTVLSSTLHDNAAVLTGGGIHVAGSAGEATLANATVASNRSAGTGAGGVDREPGSVLAARGSLIAGNGSGSGAPDCGRLSSAGFNLIGDTAGCAFAAPRASDLTDVDPGILPAAGNGGPTATVALEDRSPAVGAGPPDASATDQRGVPRVEPDIGAYELAACAGVRINRVGTQGGDLLTGTGGADGVLALGGDDRILGFGGGDGVCAGDGNDVVDAGDGADRVMGEIGEDRIAGGPGDDTLEGGADNDTLEGEAGLDALGGGVGEDAVVGGDGEDALGGGADNDELAGGDGNDELAGEVGEDQLDGGRDDDRLDGGDGNDTLLGGGGGDDLLGREDSDALRGGAGGDRLLGHDGSDDLRGSGGGDKLAGGAANDVLRGGAGADRLLGGTSADRLLGGSGPDRLAGGPDDGDQCDGGAGRDRGSPSCESRVNFAAAAAGRAVPTAARASRKRGIDVSRFQGTIDWAAVGTTKIRFAYVQASRGSGEDCLVAKGRCGEDKWYDRNYRRAKDAGITVGAYHRAFASGKTRAKAKADAKEEAKLFSRSVGKVRRSDMVPVLDVETPFTDLSPARLRYWIATWLERVERRLGAKPMIYTNASSWLATGDTQRFAKRGHRLWVANFGVDSPAVPAGNWAGQGWSVWQFTSTGSVRGIEGNVDKNRLAVGLRKLLAR